MGYYLLMMTLTQGMAVEAAAEIEGAQVKRNGYDEITAIVVDGHVGRVIAGRISDVRSLDAARQAQAANRAHNRRRDNCRDREELMSQTGRRRW